MEPDIKDMLYLWDSGDKFAIKICKGGIIGISVGDEAFYLSGRAIFSMLKFYSAAGFKLEPPSHEMLDAQRYRYLRDLAATGNDSDGPTVCSGLGDFFEYLHGPEVDEAVDEAIVAYRANPQSSQFTSQEKP